MADLAVGKPKFKKSGSGKSGPGESSNSSGATKSKGGDMECHHCHKTGHWRRTCPVYHEDIKAGRVKPVGMSSSSSTFIHMIEINHASYGTWVLDTGCGSHLCNHVQGLRNIEPLVKGEVDLRVGNGARVAAVSRGTYVIQLPSGFELFLYNCYYVPSLSKNIISVSALDKLGFSFVIENNSCIFSLHDMIYGKAVSMNGIYVLDQTTEILHVMNKKLKVGDKDQTYLWHCRMGHINEKRVKQRHKEWSYLGL